MKKVIDQDSDQKDELQVNKNDFKSLLYGKMKTFQHD